MMEAKSTLNAFKRHLVEFGWRDGMLYNLSQILGRLHIASLYKYYFYAQPLAKKAKLPARLGRNIETRWLQLGDPSLSDIPRPPNVVVQRYNQGAKCLAAFIDGKLVGCIWYVFSRYKEDEVRCDFILQDKDLCVWDFDVYVDPDYRIGIVFMHMWDLVNEHLRNCGYRWSLSRISAFNLHSIRSHERLGAQRLSSASYIAIGPIQLMFSDILPSLSLSRKQRPKLVFHAPSEKLAE